MNTIKFQIDQLELFNEKVAEFRDSSFAAAIFGPDSGISIIAEEGMAVVVQRKGPSIESIRASAPTLRLLISQRDRISFEQMGKLYRTLVTDGKYPEVPNKLLRSIEEFLTNPIRAETGLNIVPLEIDGREPNVRIFLEQFIYGDILHLDEKKRQNYVNWRSQPFIFEFALNTFCFLGAHLLNLATALSDYNGRVITRLKATAVEK